MYHSIDCAMNLLCRNPTAVNSILTNNIHQQAHSIAHSHVIQRTSLAIKWVK